MPFGNEQSQYTLDRAAFGDTTASLMQGAQIIGGGAQLGMRNLFAEVGQGIMPLGYHPVARSAGGSYGMFTTETGFGSGVGALTGWSAVPKSLSAQEQIILHAGGLGQRMAGGAMGAGAMLGGLAAGTAAGVGIGAMMGGAGGFIMGGLVAPMAGLALGEQVIKAVGQRQEIQNYLQTSSSRFVGSGSSMADPRTGAGMGVESRQQVTDFIRKMDFEDPRMDAGELGQVLQSGTQLGLFTGAGNDIESFKKKFKEITSQVKNITKVLHQTLQEGLETMKMLKDSGVGIGDITGTVNMAETTGRIAGRTSAEMLGVGAQGAAMFRGTGIDMGVGFQANMMNLASVRAARDAGALSSESVRQAGGEESMANRMTAGGLSFAQSTTGRGFAASFFNPATGGFNAAQYSSAIFGGTGMVGLAQQAAGNMSSPANLIAFQANQHKIMTDMANQPGGLAAAQNATLVAQAEFLQSALPSVSGVDAFRFSALQSGMAPADIDARLAQMQGAGGIFGAAQRSAGASHRRAVIEEAGRETVINRATRRAGDLVSAGFDYFAAPISRGIDAAGEAMIDASLNLRGVISADISANTGMFLSGGEAAAPTGTVNLDQGGFLTGGSVGSGLLDAIRAGIFDEAGVSIGQLRSASDGGVILESGSGGSRRHGISSSGVSIDQDSAERVMQYAKSWQISDTDIAQMQKKDPKFRQIRKRLSNKLMNVNMEGIDDFKDLVPLVFGEGRTSRDLNKRERGALIDAARAFGGEGLVNKFKKGIGAGLIGDAISAERVNEIQGDIEAIREGIDEDIFGDRILGQEINPFAFFSTELGMDATEKLAAAALAQQRGDPNAGRLFERAVSGFDAEDKEKIRKSFTDRTGDTLGRLAAIGGKLEQIGTVAVRKGRGLRADLLADKDILGKDAIIKTLRTGGLLALSESQLAGLDKTGIKAQYEEVTGLASWLQGQKDNQVKIDKIKGMGLTEEESRSALDILEKGDRDKFTQIIAKHKDMSFAGDTFTAGPGGGGTETGAAGSAELIKTQTRINSATLHIMEALETRIR